MAKRGLSFRAWVAPIGIAIIGGLLSCLAFWFADRAEGRRVMETLEFRADWRVRDLQAKVRLAANPVENTAIALAANPAMTPEEFAQYQKDAVADAKKRKPLSAEKPKTPRKTQPAALDLKEAAADQVRALAGFGRDHKQGIIIRLETLQ